MAREVLDRRIEVLVPPVVLHRVVVKAEGIHGLLRPRLIGDARKSRRPLETVRRDARVVNGKTELPMDSQQLVECRGRATTPAALGRDAKPRGEAAGDVDATHGPVDAIGVMNEAKIELGLRTQA
jgi:hypothetical protein